jgi:thiamine-monophosphate kinase
MDEFSLIQRYFSRHARAGHEGVVLGVGDDAAVLRPSPGHDLVMATDTLVSGRHFPADMAAFDIGWRSLAVNLSDLAAMGARPLWCLLSLTLPEADERWLAGFADGFYALADDTGVALVGGDTVRGSLAVTIQVVGQVPANKALRRSGACPGDRLCIGGTPGEAALGLRQWQQGIHQGDAVERLCRPAPQLVLGEKLRSVASACIDVSDGVLADLGHLLDASGGLGADLRVDGFPDTPLFAGLSRQERLALQCHGGDDYLLLFTLPPVFNRPQGCLELGRVAAQPGIRLHDGNGELLSLPGSGWNHFSSQGDG